MRLKTYKKSAAFAKHGKHPSVIGQVRASERERAKVADARKPKMYASVRDALRERD